MEERYAEETQTLRELLALMREHDLDTIKVKLGDTIYELSRRDSTPAAPSTAPAGAEEPVPVAGANVTKVLAPLTKSFIARRRPTLCRTSRSETASNPATCCACWKR